MSGAPDLDEAERARILAKTARFAPPAARTADGRRDLVGLARDELRAALEEVGEAPFRAKQVWHWIYYQGVTDFARMSSIAKPTQARLAEQFRHRPAGCGHRADQQRRYPQMAVPVS